MSNREPSAHYRAAQDHLDGCVGVNHELLVRVARIIKQRDEARASRDILRRKYTVIAEVVRDRWGSNRIATTVNIMYDTMRRVFKGAV